MKVYIDWYTDDLETGDRINGISTHTEDFYDKGYELNFPELEKLKKDTSAQISHQKIGINQNNNDHKTKNRWHAQGGFDALCWLVKENPEIFGDNLLEKIRKYGYDLQ